MLDQVWGMEAPPHKLKVLLQTVRSQTHHYTFRGFFCLSPYESDLFWQQKGNLNNIKQQVLILWLIKINLFTLFISMGKYLLMRTYRLCRSNLDILVNDQPQPSESQTNGLSPRNRKLNFYLPVHMI